jgi:hypothetical protein
MQPRLLLAPEAQADLAEAYAWYESQRGGLGSEFLAEVRSSCSGSNRCRVHTPSFVARHAVP